MQINLTPIVTVIITAGHILIRKVKESILGICGYIKWLSFSFMNLLAKLFGLVLSYFIGIISVLFFETINDWIKSLSPMDKRYTIDDSWEHDFTALHMAVVTDVNALRKSPPIHELTLIK